MTIRHTLNPSRYHEEAWGIAVSTSSNDGRICLSSQIKCSNNNNQHAAKSKTFFIIAMDYFYSNECHYFEVVSEVWESWDKVKALPMYQESVGITLFKE